MEEEASPFAQRLLEQLGKEKMALLIKQVCEQLHNMDMKDKCTTVGSLIDIEKVLKDIK